MPSDCEVLKSHQVGSGHSERDSAVARHEPIIEAVQREHRHSKLRGPGDDVGRSKSIGSSSPTHVEARREASTIMAASRTSAGSPDAAAWKRSTRTQSTTGDSSTTAVT